jgi:hypothetical protein
MKTSKFLYVDIAITEIQNDLKGQLTDR